MYTYFQAEEITNYDDTPNFIKNLKRSNLIDLARIYAGTGINAFAAVSSTDKATINSLAENLHIWYDKFAP